MLKTQIIAKDVANLTDARYFAAWGVDYVSFNCNKGEENYIEPSILKEIKEWIEGPHFVASFSGLSNTRDEIENLIAQLDLEGLILGPFADENILNSIDAEIVIKEKIGAEVNFENLNNKEIVIIKTDSREASKFYELGESIFLDIPNLTISKVEEILSKSKCGLVLKGGAEEKVGLKSYDFLDDVFDLLLD